MNNLIVWLLRLILPRRFWYRNFYLRSRHWRMVRRAKLEAVKYKCEKCKVKKYNGNGFIPLDVHHLTYRRIFHETLNDLQVLCRTCHKLEHSKG